MLRELKLREPATPVAAPVTDVAEDPEAAAARAEVVAKFTDAQISDIMEKLPPVYVKREDGYWETIYVFFSL